MSAKILVAVDFSPITQSVIAWATSVARSRHDSLILLHVQEPLVEPFMGEMYYPGPLKIEPEIYRALEALTPNDPEVAFERQLVLGAAPEEIVSIATQRNVDLIVMGSHGRGWLGRLLMGSVAEGVMRRAPCPVLVVSPPCGCPAPTALEATQH